MLTANVEHLIGVLHEIFLHHEDNVQIVLSHSAKERYEVEESGDRNRELIVLRNEDETE